MKHIVITWWPHAGKSTFLPHMVDELNRSWYNVKTIPEIATLLYNKWLHPCFGNISCINFHSEIFSLYTQERKLLVSKTPLSEIRNTIILSDRRIPDWSAYVTNSDYINLLSKHKLTPQKVMSEIYGVLHLESTAVWLWRYDNTSNPARIWTNIDDAIELEQKTKAAYDSYLGKRIIISNIDPKSKQPISADQKLHKSLDAIMQLVR